MSYLDQGLRSLFRLKKMQHEINAEKRAQNVVANRLGVSTLAKPVVPAPVDQRLNDLINLNRAPLNLKAPEEKKNQFGDTEADKKRMATAWITSPRGIPLRPIKKAAVKKDKWKYQAFEDQKLLDRIDKIKFENGDPPYDNVTYDNDAGQFVDKTTGKRGALSDFVKPDYNKQAANLKAVKDFHQPNKIEAKKPKPYKYEAGGWDSKRLT